MNDGVKDLERR